MKKRIWNQLKKAVMITAAVGILGAGAVSAAEFEAAELYVPAVGLKQSAQWIDEEKFQAELTLEVSGLKELYKVNRRILLRRTDSCRWKIVHGMEK